MRQALKSWMPTTELKHWFPSSDPSNPVCLGSTAIFTAEADTFLEDDSLSEEIFGPGTTIVRWSNKSELLLLLEKFEGQLTGTIHATDDDLADFSEVIVILERKVGRILYNGFPTGVEVCHSMVHGGPYPATSMVEAHRLERTP